MRHFSFNSSEVYFWNKFILLCLLLLFWAGGHSQTKVFGKVSGFLDEKYFIEYANISVKHNYAFTDVSGEFEISVNDSLFIGEIQIGHVLFESLTIINIDLNGEDIYLGELCLFKTCCTVHYDYFCPRWDFKCKRISKRANNPPKKYCKECRKEVKTLKESYTYFYNNHFYRVIDGIIDLHCPIR
jgi:hypothetical protein